jgi:hypothetical protein
MLQAVGVAILLVVLTRPLLFNGYQRGADFWVHYWYIWHQSEAVRHGGPSLFLYDTGAVFVPRYAFYGGTLYAITGTLGLLVGSVLHAYMATFVLASAAAYGGWWWLGRMAGLGRLVAHAPALVFATSAYTITLVNPRSDWPEHVGVSVVPLLVASALSILRADRLRPLPALALAVSGVLFFGSHNLALLCGTTLLVALAALSLLCIPQARRMLSGRGVARVAVILVPALLINAWFLLPDLAYQSHTIVAQRTYTWRFWLQDFNYLVALPRLLALGRGTPDPVAANWGVFALPVLAVAWTVVAAVVSRPRLGQPWFRLLLVLTAVTTVTIVAMTHVGLLRGPFTMLQYSFRLESYVNLTISGAVLVVLVLLQDRRGTVRRLCLSALAIVVAISVVQAAAQVDVHRDTSNSTDLTAFPSYYSPGGLTHAEDYGAGDLPVAPSAQNPGLARIAFPVPRARGASVSRTFNAKTGDYFVTNVVTVPQFVRVTGARLVGVDETSHTIMQVTRRSRPGPVRVTISEVRPSGVVIGQWLSLLGLLGLAAAFASTARPARARRASAASVGSADARSRSAA